MQSYRDADADTDPNLSLDRLANNTGDGMKLFKRIGAFVIVAAAFIVAAELGFSDSGSSQGIRNNYVRTYENQSESSIDAEAEHSAYRSELYIDAPAFHEPVFQPSISYHPEQTIKIEASLSHNPQTKAEMEPLALDAEFNDAAGFFLEREGFDEDSLYDPFLSQDIIGSIYYPTVDFFNDTSIGMIEDYDGDRLLQEYPTPEYLYPLPCNEGVSFDCTKTRLSSLQVPTVGPLVIECGTCVYVDTTNGQQLNLPGGLRIEGKLYFPPQASLTIRTTYVMVLGILKMDNPLIGNEVKISLYGENDIYFFASNKQDQAKTGACNAGCKIGKKPIAVLGGQLDIQGIDTDCPSWENILDQSTALTEPPTVSPTSRQMPTFSPGNACAGNLFENGDFEASSTAFSPWEPYLINTAQLFSDPLIPGNHAVMVRGRTVWAHGIRLHYQNEGCFLNNAPGTQWKLSMDVRLLDGVTGNGIEIDPKTAGFHAPLIQFQARQPNNSDNWKSYHDVEMEWKKDEWSRFSIVFDTPAEWVHAQWMRVHVQGGPDTSILVVDNISLEQFGGSVAPPTPTGDGVSILNQIRLSPKAAECWTPGSEILITSNDESSLNYQVTTIDTTDPSTGIIKLSLPINPVSTMASDPKHAVEVALLNRRIVFEADDAPDDDLIGGHLIVLLTPTVKQHLEGVEIRNFGQQGNLGRYPVHFHLCDDGFGWIVRKNVVRQSNQRCYVMHGTNGVLIEDNVAFDTFGHCFMTEDGAEHSIRFLRNLGAHIKNANRLVSESSKRLETDNFASVFWMTNMENYLEGNVVAGSMNHGYWVETHFTMVGRGPSIYQNPDHIPLKSNLGSFKNNVAHSFRSLGFTVYPPGWNPEKRAIIENLRIYRGYNTGVFLHNGIQISFVGGYIAQMGFVAIRVMGADDIIIDGMELVGNIEGEEKQCTFGQHKGVVISPHRITTRNNKNDHFGTKMKNVVFKNWEPQEGCDDPLIDVSITLIHKPGWDAYNLMENVIHDGTNPQITAACRYENEWSPDAAIEVVSDTNGVYGESGFLLGSLNVPLSGKACTDVGGCLLFCPGACLRTIKFQTSGAKDVHGYKMKVSDGTATVTVDRYYSNYNGNTLEPHYFERSYYSISLPAGSFSVWFEEESNPGVIVYPKFVLPFFETEPTCSGYATEDSITILKPVVEESRCNDLIRNGDFAGDIAGWQEFSARYFHGASAGIDGTGALVVRDFHSSTFVTQWLDVSCLVENAGVYLFQASYRVVNQVDYLSSAQDIPNLSKTPTALLMFESWNEETQSLGNLPTSWPAPIVYPTNSPTRSPNSSPTGLEIVNVFPLGICKGDCNTDSDCEAGLVCMQRNGDEPVPGCDGIAESTIDYCYDPKFLYYVGDDNSWSPGTLAMCQGDCDSDEDCQAGLKCMARSGDEPVPGCSGTAVSGRDYCYDPNSLVLYDVPLGKCQGDCVSDSDCQIGLVCMQRNGNEAVPGCEGTLISGKDYCYESTTSQNGFSLLTGMFEITPEQAAAATARIQIFNFQSSAILDNISLVRAPWSINFDDGGDDVNTVAPTDRPAASPTARPFDSSAAPTDTPFDISAAPTDSTTASPSSIPSDISAAPTGSPTTDNVTPSPTGPTEISLLPEQALALMKHIVETMQPAFESTLTLPSSGLHLAMMFDIFAVDVAKYANENFPGGVEDLDDYDDNLPENMPSLEKYLASVLPMLKQEYINANHEAITAGVQTVKSDWEKTVNEKLQAAIDEAIEKALSELLVGGLGDKVDLPYLDKSDQQSLQTELTMFAQNNGESRKQCGAIISAR